MKFWIVSLLLVIASFGVTSVSHAAERAQKKSAGRAKVKAAKTNESVQTMSVSPARAAGAVVGTIFGLGIGHPFQGRYVERGWLFTATQVAGLVLLVRGGFMGDCGTDPDGEPRRCGNPGYMSVGAAMFLVSRIWEIADLWTHLYEPDNRLDVMILPNPSGLNLALQWNF